MKMSKGKGLAMLLASFKHGKSEVLLWVVEGEYIQLFLRKKIKNLLNKSVNIVKQAKLGE